MERITRRQHQARPALRGAVQASKPRKCVAVRQSPPVTIGMATPEEYLRSLPKINIQ
jgi:hypothetical protein